MLLLWWQRCHKPISGFPSKEGLKPKVYTQEISHICFPFRDFHQKKDWNSLCALQMKSAYEPISGFPSKEGLKRTYDRGIMIGDSFPFRDFHQKKDWNTKPPHLASSYFAPISGFPSKEGLKHRSLQVLKSDKFAHFGISIKRRIETNTSKP